MDTKNKSQSTLGAYIVGAYLFSVPAFAYSEDQGLLMIPQIMGAILMAIFVLDILKNLQIKMPREIRFYGLMGLWAVLTFVFAFSQSEVERLRLGTLVKVIIATLACAHLIKDDNDLFIALKIFVFSILLIFYQNRGDLQYLRTAEKITEADRFSGTFTNPNFAAMFSLTVIWASTFLWLHSGQGIRKRILLLAPIGISLIIIYYAGSKKGLIGLGLFVLFFARLLYIRQRTSFMRKSQVILIASLLIVGVGYLIYSSPFLFRTEQLISRESVSDLRRLDLADEAIKVWLMNGKTFFIGTGFDNFKLFSSFQTYSHSTPLELLASNGIVGFFLFMAFFLLISRKFLFLYKHTHDQQSRSVFFSILIFLVIYTFFMMTIVLHDARELMPIFGCLAAFGEYRLCLLRQNPVPLPGVYEPALKRVLQA